MSGETLLQSESTSISTSRSSGDPSNTLQSAFERQVEIAPDSVAVSHGDFNLTYRDLDDRANQLARVLRPALKGDEPIVALILDRSLDMIVSILSVLKCGGAYLPMEPGLPPERIVFQLADSGAQAIISRRAEAMRAEVLERPRLFLLDEISKVEGAALEPGQVSVRNLRQATGDQLAYIIYTSGSTGRPKGVGVTHQNVLRLFSVTRNHLGFRAEDVWPLFHSYAFDFSVWEIWGALLHGGRLVIVDDETRRSPAAFLDLLIREGVSILNQTPSAFQALDLADQESARPLDALRLIIFGGEALDVARLTTWFERHGNAVELVNMYGITETTVHVTEARLSPEDAKPGAPSWVGTPLPDLEIYLLNQSFDVVSEGEVGEIYIVGPGLARGYHNRPGLTAERFIACPIGAPGRRMYRSGDLARRRQDGGFDYLGRADQQVKIRGFRIEPGEIEAALLAMPGIAQASVQPREIAGEVRLVGYIVAKSGETPPLPSELRRLLANRLPDYMVPAAFVPLDVMPLTTNGKLDRSALQTPNWIETGAPYRAPRDKNERLLCRLFAELTGAERVGLDDRFLALGGHSLLAIKLIARLRQETGIEVPLRAVFEFPTPEALARLMVGASDEGERPVAPNTRLPGVSLVDLFVVQVGRTPDHPAVTCRGESLSYWDLNERADRLAGCLTDRGAGPGCIVAVALERSLDLVVAILAIVKSGAAYLPLELAAPTHRLAFMLADSGAMLALANGDTIDFLESMARIPVIDVRLPPQEPLGAPIAITESSLAYVIYTSGSTGLPKGVAVTHANVVALVPTMALFSPGAGESWVMFHSHAFDVSVWEFWIPLLHGGRLVLVDEATRRDPDAFLKFLEAEQVTGLCQTPSAFYPLMEVVRERGRLDLGLKHIIFVGEALDFRRLAPWYERLGDGGPRLVNMYGPTEATVYCTLKWVDRALSRNEPASLIGAPIQGAELWVLDEALNGVGPGESGELYVGGAGVALGYHGRPGLTSQRFIASPFGPPGARLYRTGDLVRWQANNELEYLGRNDGQLKIRGFRVEIGEIEVAMAKVPGLVEVAVEPKMMGGEQRLVGYVTGRRGEPPPQHDEIRAALGSWLPAYMTPAYFVTLDSMPLSVSGKLDRSALPTPMISGEDDSREPQTETVRRLCDLFARLTGAARVGPNDSFFSLGGHSLLAVKLLHLIRRELSLDTSLFDLMNNATPAKLAEVLAPFAPVDPEEAPSVSEGHAADGTVPLSRGQKRLWLLNQIDGPSGAYNLARIWSLSGAVDVGALGEALADMVQRHEPLRTNIVEVGGQPIGQLRSGPPPARLLRIEAINAAPGPDQDAAVNTILAAEANHPFDLAVDLLLRARLLRLSALESVLVITIHHMASDGASEPVFNGDLSKAYAARRAGVPPEFSPLPQSYADHAAWLEVWLEKASNGARQAAYWRRVLAGAPERLALPTDFPRQAIRHRPAGVIPLLIDADLAMRLRSVAAETGSTLFVVLLSAWARVLGALSGQDDLIIGTPTASRDREETDALVGFLVNSLALRIDLSGFPTARTLLERVRDVVLGALENHAIPFDQIVEEAAIGRTPGVTPLFQVMFAWQTQDSAPLRLDGLSTAPITPPMADAKFDLTLQLTPAEQGAITGELEFDSSLFEPASARRLGSYLIRALEHLAAGAGEDRAAHQPFRAFSLLAKEERAEQLTKLDSPRLDAPRMALATAFRRQAQSSPTAVALTMGAQNVTYAELEQRSDRLAEVLRRRGVASEAVVAMAIPPSPEAIIALLAILKAGAAYLPLSAKEPEDRLRHILRNSNVKLWIGAGAISPSVMDLVPVISLDDPTLEAEISCAWEPLEVDDWSPGRLAYVIYTSGSTGQPKGVAVTQDAVMSLAWRPAYAPIGPGRAVLQFAPLAFDAATFEIWGALLNGARLVIAPQAPLDLDALARIVSEEKVDILWLTSGLFAQVVETHPHVLSGVSHLLAGGDVLPPASVARTLSLNPGLTLINGYGPTETTTFACVHPISDDDALGISIPIGRPIEGAGVLILDQTLELCPWGAVGDLYVVGAGLGRGYVGDPMLTAEKFLACPFGPPGSRMYRTGDLARWRADGAIEFVGRADQQVKIRGYRVEPAEIEVALAATADIAEAVVVPRQFEGETRLLAYVVMTEGRQFPGVASLRAALASRLPDYMVPSTFAAIDRIPLTANGKVDRPALPTPSAEPSPDPLPPKSLEESTLCQIFARLTGVGSVSPDEDFFDLGGHSLLGLKLIFEVEKAFGVRLPLRDLFLAPTPAALARRLKFGPTRHAFISLVPLASAIEGEPVFMIHWLEQDLARHLGRYMPIYGLSFGLGDTAAHHALDLPDRIEDIAAHYVAEMKALRPTGPYHLVGHSAGGLVAFEMARQLAEAGDDVGLLALLDTYLPRQLAERRFVPLSRVLTNLSRIPPRALIQYARSRLKARLEKITLFRRALMRFLPAPETLRLRLVNDFMDRYRPGAYSGQIWLFKSSAPFFHIRSEPPPPPELGWREVSGGAVEIVEIDGDHMAMVKDPIARSTADAILRAITELRARRRPQPSRDAG